MTMKREEILQLAARYIEADDANIFPMDGELFCILSRHTAPAGAGEERWQFGGYGICAGYRQDDSSRPAGKWLWFEFISLADFPPQPAALKLQPPHVVRGMFNSPDRGMEFRIHRVVLDHGTAPGAMPADSVAAKPLADNCIAFPANRRASTPEGPHARRPRRGPARGKRKN